MMRAVAAAILLACLARPAAADFAYPRLPDAGTRLADFVPEGWTVLEEARGDLNQDAYDDIAAVIETVEPVEHVPGCDKWRESSSRSPRMLIVLLAERSNGFRLAAENRTIVLRADEGGIFGDPFYSISVERGAVVLRHYGGSAWRWGNTYRFRLQDGGWFLIGYTDDSHHTVSRHARRYDYNPLTGKVKITTTGENGKIGCYRCFKGEPCPPSPGCEKNETQAGAVEVWKDLGKRPLVPLEKAACISILPFVPYE